ncbi:hypothetical protein [Acinetobacter colistiniresistens]|uniref:hypothetical protein n=1 Tax=Acinetobacter colistiniresistens TaxID=280145 RepID=UPI0003A97E91|nr:hypothetical protein [Acinetobacter colistiniresistens]
MQGIQANQAKAIRSIHSSVSDDVHIADSATTFSLDKSIISGDIYGSIAITLQANLNSIEGQKLVKFVNQVIFKSAID